VIEIEVTYTDRQFLRVRLTKWNYQMRARSGRLSYGLSTKLLAKITPRSYSSNDRFLTFSDFNTRQQPIAATPSPQPHKKAGDRSPAFVFVVSHPTA
jgi:hypothetical protein